MIEAKGLTKRYGDKLAVDHISFQVRPGIVTGFLGPNGAGKSTTMRMIMGLDRPTSGTVTVNGVSYAGHRAPMVEVGALLEARAVHPGRSARQHLRVLAATHGIPDARVDEVIALTGLGPVADKRVGGFSLGMGQRLGIASALLGDPKTLILDEPVNGLDPEGVLWVRNLAKYLASQGRTIFLSSHLMSEMAITADHVIVIGRGKILADVPIAELVGGRGRARVKVVTPDAELLRQAVAVAGGAIADGVTIISGAANAPENLGLPASGASSATTTAQSRPIATPDTGSIRAGADPFAPPTHADVVESAEASVAAQAGYDDGAEAELAAHLAATAPPTTRLTRRERRTGALPAVHPGGRPVYSLVVEGIAAPALGQIALVNGVELHELTPQESTLEEAYMALTADALEFHTEQLAGQPAATAAATKTGGK